MNIRKIKLALTVGLMNNEKGVNVLPFIVDQMNGFKDEVGTFISTSEVRKNHLNRNNVKKTYAMRFENVTLNVDLVSNPMTNSQTVHGFQFR